MAPDEVYSPAQWEEIPTTTEQMALIDFAYHLGTYVAITQDTSTNEEDVREEAQLLLSLLSSQPPCQKLSFDEAVDSAMSRSQNYGQDYASRQGTSEFSFSCPALSLERNHQDSDKSTSSEKSDSSVDTVSSLDDSQASPPPAVLFARPLVIEDPEALCLTSEKIGRNVLQSFHKALDWRMQTWANSLSRILAEKERELKAQGADEQDLQELLKTTEAQVIASLRVAATDLKFIAARTSFHVLPQRIANADSSGAPPNKKQKLDDAASLTTETSYTYRVSHALNFETVIDLKTPAGYAEVTIEAPGIIEGTFLSSDDGQEVMTDVKIHIDTHVLATMIERSSRVVAKASSEALLTPQPSEQDEEEPLEQESPDEGFTSPQPYTPKKNGHTEGPQAVIVTPRHPSPPSSYCDSDVETNDKPVYFPMDILDEEEDGPVRMVSPQPRSPDMVAMKFSPRTPTKSNKISAPTLVSPRPLVRDVSEPEEGSTASHLTRPDETSPSFPSLVEAACAAMRAC